MDVHSLITNFTFMAPATISFTSNAFALDTDIDLPEVSGQGDLATAMIGHILGEGILMGR